MLTPLEEVTNKIDSLLQNPEIEIENRLKEVTDSLSTLTPSFSQTDGVSVYQTLLNLRNLLCLNPQKWVTLELERLYREQFILDETLESYKKYLRHKVDIKRDEKIFGDIEYIFPGDTEPDRIQLRNERDRQNLQDNVISAQAEVFQGKGDSLNNFMPMSNKLKQISSNDMLDIGIFLKKRGEMIYGAAWAHKFHISSLTTKEELDNYDFSVNWPEETLNDLGDAP